MIATTLLILTLNLLWTVSQAMPLIDLKDTLEQNVLQPVVASRCSSNGCWGWLPVQEVEDDVDIVPNDLDTSRLHTRRQTPDAEPSTVLQSWDDVPMLEKKSHSSAPATRHIGNRVTKKDMFVSRSWSAGGMPFSVLYMNPHGPRGNHAGTTQQEGRKPTESLAPPSVHPNYRIALRNGTPGQPRRQYSTIPQLFISYGWGSFGK